MRHYKYRKNINLENFRDQRIIQETVTEVLNPNINKVIDSKKEIKIIKK